jgi:hypothetical protein
VRGGDEPHAPPALDPHVAVRVDAGAPRAASAPTEDRAERVGVPVGVAGPIPDAGVDDVELEGEDVLEDVRAGGRGRDAGEHAEEVRRLGRGLVEEAEAGEGGEAEGPELRWGGQCRSVVEMEEGGDRCAHLARGKGPPDLLARCGRVPFGPVHASCSSSIRGTR